LDSPEDYAFDLLFKLAMPDQKMGRSILGSADVIARLPRQAVVDYVECHYTAANMVVTAAGKIDHEEFKAWVEKRLGKLPRGKKPQADRTRIAGGDKRHDKEIEQVHLILGFPGPGIHAREIYPTQVLSNLLGGNASSRLFQKVREKRGLVYTVSSAHAGYSDTGLFYIYAGTDPKRLRELVPVVCEELRDVSRKVTRGEVARAKAQIRADMLMGEESVGRRAEILANQLLSFGKPIPVAHVLKRLSQVGEEDVQAMAAKLFARKPLLTALGPLGELEPYGALSQRLRHA
jgi:predicted Zn-dependent peptidase